MNDRSHSLRTRHFPAIILLILSLTTGLAQEVSQDSLSTVSSIMPNEISLGIGVAYSPEKDMFNAPTDASAGTNVGLSFAYRRNLDEHWAIGGDMYGYVTSVDDAAITKDGVTKNYELTVSTLNIGAECRYVFSREVVHPYALLFLSYAAGSLSNNELGTLSLNGVSGGGGIGLNYPLGVHWGLSLEGIASFGTAKWEHPPFTNSTSDDFNPTMYMGMIRVSYLWE